MMTLRAFVLAASVAMAGPAASDSGGGSIVVTYAEKAISKGYGEMCSLEMVPVRSGGYFPCLDFGPYRYVRGYETVSAFVVQKGKVPFKVMDGSPGDPRYLYAGPWVDDMPMKIVDFWNDTVSGGGQRAREAVEEEERKRAAEQYINSLTKKPQPVSKEVATQAATEGKPPAPDVFSDPVGLPVPENDLKSVLGTVAQ